MVAKVKEYFEKTRKLKNNDKSKKYILRGQKMQNITIEFYLEIRNLVISHNILL